MDLFDGPRRWTVEEQIVEDPASGLTFQFEVLPNGHCALRVFGNLPFGNRELIFDSTGRKAGAGTALQGPNLPTWHLNVDSQLREC
jgi:hypothetical protein